MVKHYRDKRKRRKARIRAKIYGSEKRPRLSIFRSNRYIYGQLIDDTTGRTLLAGDDRQFSKSTKKERARKAGKVLGRQALKRGIKTIVFDRGGYKYHGRVKAFAEGVREEGLKF